MSLCIQGIGERTGRVNAGLAKGFLDQSTLSGARGALRRG